MATELIPHPTGCTLYQLEDNLQSFVNSIELTEEPSARELLLNDIAEAVGKTKEKRDAVAAFLRHCELQQKFADAEIERLQKRKAFIARVEEELERHVIRVIEQFAVPDRRGTKRLEGNFSNLRIQKNPDSVLIEDLDALPTSFKQVVLTMPAYVWEALLQRIGSEDRKTFETSIQKLEFRADKKAIGAELKRGTQIPGADLKFGEWRLVIS